MKKGVANKMDRKDKLSAGRRLVVCLSGILEYPAIFRQYARRRGPPADTAFREADTHGFTDAQEVSAYAKEFVCNFWMKGRYQRKIIIDNTLPVKKPSELQDDITGGR